MRMEWWPLAMTMMMIMMIVNIYEPFFCAHSCEIGNITSIEIDTESNNLP